MCPIDELIYMCPIDEPIDMCLIDELIDMCPIDELIYMCPIDEPIDMCLIDEPFPGCSHTRPSGAVSFLERPHFGQHCHQSKSLSPDTPFRLLLMRYNWGQSLDPPSATLPSSP